MQISPNVSSSVGANTQTQVKSVFTEKLSKSELSDIKEQIAKNANEIVLNSISLQGSFSNKTANADGEYDKFQSFLGDIGYSGKPIAKLSKEEATELVSKDGFFGVDKTSQRIADFVIMGAGGDESKMRAGREGMIKGFKDAEAMWGGKLPEISQETMKKSIEMVDKAMHDLGFSIIDKEV
ncbi:hypothetical protein [Sulfurimonas sp.]|uniref:hypothetical protein n=1 Tax=Sulfurimonas sp. TaxID=2022749 RepID=UPI0025CFDDCD|nr:hypothetical protein [Sulfurimonas sp.]MDD5156501.1 hypothetical protein [Sulfurimonas sp.]